MNALSPSEFSPYARVAEIMSDGRWRTAGELVEQLARESVHAPSEQGIGHWFRVQGYESEMVGKKYHIWRLSPQMAEAKTGADMLAEAKEIAERHGWRGSLFPPSIVKTNTVPIEEAMRRVLAVFGPNAMSAGTVAKKAGMGDETAFKALRQLREDGVLVSWQDGPNAKKLWAKADAYRPDPSAERWLAALTGPMTTAELAEAAGGAARSASDALRKLAHRGLVRKAGTRGAATLWARA